MSYQVRSIGSMVALIASSAGAQLHCGSLVSPSGQLKSGLTLRSGQYKEYVTAYVCDRAANCDTVYEAPADSKVSLSWKSPDSLIFRTSGGRLLPANTFPVSGTGRPPVKLTLLPLNKNEKHHDQILTFQRSKCASEPPIVDVNVDPTKR